ncbi:MAG: aminodeoxychorismate/anthranilate synthase component II [Ignavibacteriales bacterium]|nr:aminodeoxychorismate/anthranilate synthase component II [Ignavibacteriales bacterium]
MKVLVIDNYDSFTFNLVQLIGKLTNDVVVRRNDRTSLEEIDLIKPDKIVVSPGPGKPEDSKISLEVIKECGKKNPVLGVCLGHQGIGISFGGKVVKAPFLMHGKTSEIIHDGEKIYKGLPQKFQAGRYHSLVIDRDSLPDDLIITAETKDGVIMGVRHKNFPVEGIQFHPESVLTPQGESLIKNWLSL